MSQSMPHIHKYNQQQQQQQKEMYAHAFYISYKLKFLAIYIIKNSSGEVGEGVWYIFLLLLLPVQHTNYEKLFTSYKFIIFYSFKMNNFPLHIF